MSENALRIEKQVRGAPLRDVKSTAHINDDSNYARYDARGLPDKPCYYHYHYHYRPDRPLDEPHNLIDNVKLSKQKTAKPQQATR